MSALENKIRRDHQFPNSDFTKLPICADPIYYFYIIIYLFYLFIFIYFFIYFYLFLGLPLSATIENFYNNYKITTILVTATSLPFLAGIIYSDITGNYILNIRHLTYYFLSQLNDFLVTGLLIIILYAILVTLICLILRRSPPSWVIFIGVSLIMTGVSYVALQRTALCQLQLGTEYLGNVTKKSNFLIKFLVNYDENGMTSTITGLVNNTILPAGRLQHQKSHGCVTAKLTVDRNISKEFQYGIFSNPGMVYDTIVRFSNGAQKGKITIGFFKEISVF